MSRIMEAWEALLREAVTSDTDAQQYALFQIGLVLQYHNPHVTPDSDVYEKTLSRELLRLTLDDRRQRDTVLYLADLAQRQPRQAASFLYAMGNTQPKILIEPLVSFLQAMGRQLKNDAAYQALLALDGAMRDGDVTIIEDVLKRQDIAPLLEHWAESSDDLLADKAESVLNKIEKLVGE